MIISMFGIITCLIVLAIVFYQSAAHAPKISYVESTHFGLNATCHAYSFAGNRGDWNCMTCLKAASNCAFCANQGNELLPGACVTNIDGMKASCHGEHRVYFTEGCPSKFGFLAIVLLGAYIISYAPGMGTVPWIVNSEIYPLRYRGIGGGIAAVANWTSNLIVSETFLTLTQALGSAGTFLLFSGFSAIGLICIYFLVPETKGLPIEEVERMLEKGFKPKVFGWCNKDKETKGGSSEA